MSEFLPDGCYQISYSVTQGDTSRSYDGTFRLREAGGTVASGDLYERTVIPKANGTIPIFPIDKYRYYLEVAPVHADDKAGTLELEFTLHRYDPAVDPNSLTPDATVTGVITSTPPSIRSGFRSVYFEGDVRDSNGAAGHFTMGWVNKSLRRARLEIERQNLDGVVFPFDNQGSFNWKSVFEKVGWDMVAKKGTQEVDPADGPTWDQTQLFAALQVLRPKGDLNKEWQYHLLCVPQIISTSGERYYGLMYDQRATDSDKLPREGAAVAFDPLSDNRPEYFRTALHEIGHAAGLRHPVNDRQHIMCITDELEDGGDIPGPIKFSFADDHIAWLAHGSDIFIRPGGAPFSGSGDEFADKLIAVKGLEFELAVLEPTVPLGAPVRVNFRLTNTKKSPANIPKNLDLKSAHLKGRVIRAKARDVKHSFRSIFRCTGRGDEYFALLPGKSIVRAATLLRGPKGALFPEPDRYEVMVEVSWYIDGKKRGFRDKVTVVVTDANPDDPNHEIAARKLLKDPDTLLSLALGGDYAKKSLALAQKSPTLRRHYAMIRAKQLFKKPARAKEACDLLDEDAVLSSDEIKRTVQWINATTLTCGDSGTLQKVNELIARLKKKVGSIGPLMDEDVKGTVEQL